MPIVEITMIEGRTPEAKRRLIAKVTDAIVEAIEAPRELSSQSSCARSRLSISAPGARPRRSPKRRRAEERSGVTPNTNNQ